MAVPGGGDRCGTELLVLLLCLGLDTPRTQAWRVSWLSRAWVTGGGSRAAALSPSPSWLVGALPLVLPADWLQEAAAR